MGTAAGILVVEDEPLIAMAVAQCVEDAGFEVIGPAPDPHSAMQLARSQAVSAALLDANLAGHGVADVAAVLEAAGTPFAFLTGYGREALPERYRDRPMLSKPFDDDERVRMIRLLAARAR